MKTMQVKLYVQAVKLSFESAFEIGALPFKRTSDEHQVVVDICERIVTIDVPEIEEAFLVAGQIDQIEKSINEEIKRSTDRVKMLNEEKAKLLSIENKAV